MQRAWLRLARHNLRLWACRRPAAIVVAGIALPAEEDSTVLGMSGITGGIFTAEAPSHVEVLASQGGRVAMDAPCGPSLAFGRRILDNHDHQPGRRHCPRVGAADHGGATTRTRRGGRHSTRARSGMGHRPLGLHLR